MVDVLFASLTEALRSNSDFCTGNSDLKDVQESSSRFIKALSSLIDRRIDANIEERRKFKSQEKASVKALIAINSAPPPPDEVELIDPHYVHEWFAQYKHWFENKRNKAVNSG